MVGMIKTLRTCFSLLAFLIVLLTSCGMSLRDESGSDVFCDTDSHAENVTNIETAAKLELRSGKPLTRIDNVEFTIKNKCENDENRDGSVLWSLNGVDYRLTMSRKPTSDMVSFEVREDVGNKIKTSGLGVRLFENSKEISDSISGHNISKVSESEFEISIDFDNIEGERYELKGVFQFNMIDIIEKKIPRKCEYSCSATVIIPESENECEASCDDGSTSSCTIPGEALTKTSVYCGLAEKVCEVSEVLTSESCIPSFNVTPAE